jgi:hypothetical protein
MENTIKLSVDVGKFYLDSGATLWKVNGKTKNVSCSGELYHCERVIKNSGHNYLTCTKDGMFLNIGIVGVFTNRLRLVSEYWN